MKHRLSALLVSSLMAAPAAAYEMMPTAIYAAEQSDIYLTAQDEGDNVAFAISNMLPGDTETKTFRVSVKGDEPLPVTYTIRFHGGDLELADYVDCLITLDGDTVLYDGKLADVPSTFVNDANCSSGSDATQVYQVTFSMDTSVGNEAQGLQLMLDMKWEIEKEDTPEEPDDNNPGTDNPDDETPGPGATGDGNILPDPNQPTDENGNGQNGNKPDTDGNNSGNGNNGTQNTQNPSTAAAMHTAGWVAAAAGALGAIVLMRRRKGEKHDR
jgi:hypothetical protein